MQLFETINGEVKVRLLKDHQPNQAMINEFQTAQFDCKMTKMELCGRSLHGFEVEEPACFLKAYLSLRNVMQESIFIYKDVIELNEDETAEGCLIFLIPHGAAQLLFTYSEYADEDDPGKTYRLRYVLK